MATCIGRKATKAAAAKRSASALRIDLPHDLVGQDDKDRTQRDRKKTQKKQLSLGQAKNRAGK